MHLIVCILECLGLAHQSKLRIWKPPSSVDIIFELESKSNFVSNKHNVIFNFISIFVFEPVKVITFDIFTYILNLNHLVVDITMNRLIHRMSFYGVLKGECSKNYEFACWCQRKDYI